VPIQWDSDIKRTLGISEIKSISFFNPDARKAINPDEHPCPECGCPLHANGICEACSAVDFVLSGGHEEKM